MSVPIYTEQRRKHKRIINNKQTLLKQHILIRHISNSEFRKALVALGFNMDGEEMARSFETLFGEDATFVVLSVFIVSGS